MDGAGSGKYNRLPQLFQPGCFLLFLCPFMFLCLCLCFVIAGSLSICLSPFGESWSHFDPVCDACDTPMFSAFICRWLGEMFSSDHGGRDFMSWFMYCIILILTCFTKFSPGTLTHVLPVRMGLCLVYGKSG